MVDNEGLKVFVRAADGSTQGHAWTRAPDTGGCQMKYRLYNLAVTFAVVLTAIGMVGTNGAKWG
jgi:hypothetical protein